MVSGSDDGERRPPDELSSPSRPEKELHELSFKIPH